MCLIMLAALMGGGLTAYAESPVSSSDGTYSVPVNFDGLTMGADSFSSAATVEKSGKNYYMTFGHSSSVDDLVLESGNMQTGYTVRTENGWTYYTYTMSAERLQSSLSFTAYIVPMSMTVDFSITLNLSAGTRTGDYVDVGERPAEYVPVIETSAGAEYEAARGTVFPIPSAAATLGSENLDVSISAYYVQGGKRTDVAITNNSITLENVGEYHVVYRAESGTYLTNIDNPSYTEYDVKITSSAGGSTLARVEDPNGVLPEGTSILPSRITAGTLYEQAAEKMKSIADNFEVFGISLVQSDGTASRRLSYGGGRHAYGNRRRQLRTVCAVRYVGNGYVHRLYPRRGVHHAYLGVCGHPCRLRPRSGCGDHRYGRSRPQKEESKENAMTRQGKE